MWKREHTGAKEMFSSEEDQRVKEQIRLMSASINNANL